MIDLHMHSTYSDGTDKVKMLLKKAGDLDLEMISITDHNSVEAYYEIDKMKDNLFVLYKGLIMKGCEFTTSFDGRLIEVLGYHFDYKKVDVFLKKYYNPTRKKQIGKQIEEKLLSKLKELGITYHYENIKKKWFQKQFIFSDVYKEIIKYEENKQKLGEDVLQSFSHFYRTGIMNPKSPLFIDATAFYPPLNEIVDAVHKAGGIVIFAHPYQYKFTDTEQFMDKLLAFHKLDGLECFYPTFTKEQTEYLVSYCNKYHLLMSGGSDYHGKNKENYKMGTGFDNLHISKQIVTRWIEKPRPGKVI